MTVEDEERLLVEAMGVVREAGVKVKQSLDDERIGTRAALAHTALMLGELKTSNLSPKNYYQLYMVISDHLRSLSEHLTQDSGKGAGDVITYYTDVQYFSSIVPRLYLLITVGRTCMLTRPSTVQPILRDLVEMCRGVQHPVRGLFLRHYLLHCVRDILPRLVESDSSDSTLRDVIDFLLVNFGEMNKLWVRMQHQGHSRERERREKEREELKILVGMNLVRLSELEVPHERYTRIVLPGILEQVVSCKDPISQEYLMDCIIQVFPAENHLSTFGPFLKSCAKLHPDVKAKGIVVGLAERVGQAAGAEASNRFEDFIGDVKGFLEARECLLPEDLIQIQVALLKVALKLFPTHYTFVDKVLHHTYEHLQRLEINRVKQPGVVSKELRRLLSLPVEHYNNILTVLELDGYVPLLQVLDKQGQKNLGVTILNNIFTNGTLIPSAAATGQLLKILVSLIEEESDMKDMRDDEELSEELGLIARLVHHLRAPSSLEEDKAILLLTQKEFLQGGDKMTSTLPPLLFALFQLAIEVASKKESGWEPVALVLLQTAFETNMTLSRIQAPELALKIFLHGTLVIDQIDIKEKSSLCYQYFSQALIVYEEEMCNSKTQLGALSICVGTLERIQGLGNEEMKTLSGKCVAAGAGLLKHADQVRGGLICAHLEKRPQALLDLLIRGLRTASKVIDRLIQIQLLVELLNELLFFFEKGLEGLSLSSINAVASLIKERLPNLEASEEADQISKHYSNTMDHLQLVLQDIPQSNPSDRNDQTPALIQQIFSKRH